ncbi:hypothetical protein BCIN_15g02680 [Botrytis cinerea B05.10]|uniref:Uncharacterized protein n=1 Tax=Botryotinia fuckeliana (strain B05.10) TaxID=332648 RepID=A0A384K4H2_BOTFB|nr:hypothetical protein BCIN_15g02680 [Botrytis cinerea B05.10]ATZ57726.1 hypothetical protein BCIN_15g02680 [Botrytis cinerea B05.10]
MAASDDVTRDLSSTLHQYGMFHPKKNRAR